MISIDKIGKKYCIRNAETDEQVISITVIQADDLYQHLGIDDIELTKVTNYVNLVKHRVEQTGLDLCEVYWHCTASESFDLWDVVGECYDREIGVAIIEFRDENKH